VSAENPFRELIRRVRTGDQDAASELVQQYEPTIRRVVRVRLTDTRLRAALDSMDICQSVLASFFVRTALGQYELETPDQLLKLLATITRNKLADQARKQRVDRRENLPSGESRSGDGNFVAAEPSPSRQLAARDLLQEVRRRLTSEERQLLELRDQGLDWGQIATARNGSPEALRKRLARAIDRVSAQLGLEDYRDE
jgi:RNA polymerase sigma factor (sigma-70 family)